MVGFKHTAVVVLLAAGLFMAHAAHAAGTVAQEGTDGAHNKPSATYVPGDKGPDGGKVYFVDASGEHGLEAQAADEITSLIWDDAVSAAGAYGSGWHLPTKSELKMLYEQRTVVGGFAKDDYWSSTELDSNSAWIQGFANGDQDRYNKYSKLSVRAVRAF